MVVGTEGTGAVCPSSPPQDTASSKTAHVTQELRLRFAGAIARSLLDSMDGTICAG